MVAETMADELLDADSDFVQEDEDDSDDDELQKLVTSHHTQFAMEQQARREAIRASRPWSAPPLMSPRPETQRAKKVESAVFRQPQAVAFAESQPREEYQPPENREGFNGSSLPATMAHLARRPVSAGHLRPNTSTLGGQPLENILEDLPLEASASTVASSPRSGVHHTAPGLPTVDSCARTEVDEIQSCDTDSCPDDDLYDQVGKSVSQLPSRRFTAHSDLDSLQQEQEPLLPALEPGGAASAVPSDCESDATQEPEDALETQPSMNEAQPDPIQTGHALHIPTTSAAARAQQHEHQEQSSQDEDSEDIQEDETEDGQDAASDYGELLHPHEFALHLLHNDAGWVPPPPQPKASKAQEPEEDTASASKPCDCDASSAPAGTGSLNKTVVSNHTRGKQHTNRSAARESDGGGAVQMVDEELLDPQSFALQLLQHDAGTLAPVQQAVAGRAGIQGRAARPRSAGPAAGPVPICAGQSACAAQHAPKWLPVRASTRQGLPAASARMVLGGMHRAVGRPQSAPAHRANTRITPAGYTAFVSHGHDTGLERRRGPYLNMATAGSSGKASARGSARQLVSHTLQVCHATGPLVSDDEAEVEVLHGEDRCSGGMRAQPELDQHPMQRSVAGCGGGLASGSNHKPRRSSSRPSTAPIGGRVVMRPVQAGSTGAANETAPLWSGSVYEQTDVSPSAGGLSTTKGRTSRRPASAHPLSRQATTHDILQDSSPASAFAQALWYPLGSTAVVGVGGAQVSVYMADTVKRVQEANRWLGILGMHHRYRLTTGLSSVEVQVYDSRWLPPQAVMMADPDEDPGANTKSRADWGAMAPTIRKCNVGQFLTAYSKLQATIEKLLGGGTSDAARGAGRRGARPKSAAAAGTPRQYINPAWDTSTKNDTNPSAAPGGQRGFRGGRLSDEGLNRGPASRQAMCALLGALHTCEEVAAHIGKIRHEL